MHKELTESNKKILQFLKQYVKQNNYPPTHREIANHFGHKTLSQVQKSLTNLEQNNFIKKIPGLSRSITILQDNDT